MKFGQDAFGSWAEITKRQPKGMDAWSHWEHGPDNNPVSTDSVIKAPYRTQWLGGPLYSAMPAITTAAGGRIFTALGHIAHHRREEPWLNMLLARNGYNGTFLWSRKLPDGYLVHRSAFVATEDYFYLIDNDGCLRLDPETGRQIDRIHVPEVEGEWSCARLTATPDSFFCRGWPEGLTRYDRSTGVISFNGAMRPACNDGIIAANGMLYLGPWLCDCNLSLMATFGLCSAGEFRVEDEDPVSQRLEVSEAGNSVVPFPEISVEDWPTYRASNRRNACSDAIVSAAGFLPTQCPNGPPGTWSSCAATMGRFVPWRPAQAS